MSELIVLFILGLALYGAYALVRDLRGKIPQDKVQQITTAALVAVLGTMALLPGGGVMAQTEVPLELELDLNPLFTNINTYFPVFFTIFAIIGGIVISMILAKWIINAIKGAFEGKDL